MAVVGRSRKWRHISWPDGDSIRLRWLQRLAKDGDVRFNDEQDCNECQQRRRPVGRHCVTVDRRRGRKYIARCDCLPVETSAVVGRQRSYYQSRSRRLGVVDRRFAVIRRDRARRVAARGPVDVYRRCLRHPVAVRRVDRDAGDHRNWSISEHMSPVAVSPSGDREVNGRRYR